MTCVRVFDVAGRYVLVSLESARKSAAELKETQGDQDGLLRLALSGIRGVAPSFLDEALLVVEEYIVDCGQPDATVVFDRPPTVMAAKHHAIAYGRTLVETENGDWEFQKA